MNHAEYSRGSLRTFLRIMKDIIELFERVLQTDKKYFFKGSRGF